MTPSAAARVSRVTPHPVSGIVDCPADLTFQGLSDGARRSGWSLDGLQPERREATIGQLLERRQPRPATWASGLLPQRLCRVVARFDDRRRYASIRAPRRASGPDLGHLFVGAEGAVGAIERASLALLRPAPLYLVAEGQYADAGALFEAARSLCLVAPLAYRRIDWASQALKVAVPAPPQLDAALELAVTQLGLSVARADDAPEDLRFRPDAPGSGAELRLCGPYGLIAEALATVDAKRGRRRAAVELDYADAHGARLRVGMSDKGLDLLGALYDDITARRGWHDAELIAPGGTKRRVAALGLGGAAA